LQIVLIAIGKTQLKGVSQLTEEYAKRLSKYTKFSEIYIPDVKKSAQLPKEKLLQLEEQLILNQLKPNDFIILLDENGKSYSSTSFALILQDWIMKSQGRIVFVIGGAYGFSQEIYKRSTTQMSLSPMTFNHQMVRAIFIEQLYRAFTISRGEPYHHE
jgi:23S rRNA (pseudouridine1915-N3)-methyltransferase